MRRQHATYIQKLVKVSVMQRCIGKATKKQAHTRINKAKTNTEQHKWKSKLGKIAKKNRIHADQLVELMLCDYGWIAFVFATHRIGSVAVAALQLRRLLLQAIRCVAKRKIFEMWFENMLRAGACVVAISSKKKLQLITCGTVLQSTLGHSL